jgi:hypothetical protein
MATATMYAYLSDEDRALVDRIATALEAIGGHLELRELVIGDTTGTDCWEPLDPAQTAADALRIGHVLLTRDDKAPDAGHLWVHPDAASIERVLDRLPVGFQFRDRAGDLWWRRVDGWHSGDHPSEHDASCALSVDAVAWWTPLTVEAVECPTCTYPRRETDGMVCQTCGTDYAAEPDTEGPVDPWAPLDTAAEAARALRVGDRLVAEGTGASLSAEGMTYTHPNVASIAAVLAALPVGAQVRDQYGALWTRDEDGWHLPAGESRPAMIPAKCAPLTVEALPEPDDDLPPGLTLSDDGHLLNWRGENYVRQAGVQARLDYLADLERDHQRTSAAHAAAAERARADADRTAEAADLLQRGAAAERDRLYRLIERAQERAAKAEREVVTLTAEIDRLRGVIDERDAYIATAEANLDTRTRERDVLRARLEYRDVMGTPDTLTPDDAHGITRRLAALIGQDPDHIVLVSPRVDLTPLGHGDLVRVSVAYTYNPRTEAAK